MSQGDSLVSSTDRNNKADSLQCAIESVKTAADVYMPVDGKISKVNNELEDEPQKISIGAESEGWLIELEISNTSQLDNLLDQAAYDAYLEELKEEED